MTMRTLRETAERQLGLITSSDLREHLPRQVARTAERKGWLVRVRPHVLSVAGAPRTWEQAVMAAVLSAGPDAVASHRTAAALWQLPGHRRNSSTAIDVTVPRGRRPTLPGFHLHTTVIGPGCHRAVVGRVPVTDVARTVCDLDGVMADEPLGRALDDALVRRLVTIAELAEVHAELRRGSRRSGGVARLLTDRGSEWEDAESPPEARLVRWLVEARLPPPVQQHRIDRYRIDLAYPDAGVLIEYDGFAEHTTRTRFDDDRRRGNVLALRPGIVVLRYTSRSTREEVVRDVTAALARHAT